MALSRGTSSSKDTLEVQVDCEVCLGEFISRCHKMIFQCFYSNKTLMRQETLASWFFLCSFSSASLSHGKSLALTEGLNWWPVNKCAQHLASFTEEVMQVPAWPWWPQYVQVSIPFWVLAQLSHSRTSLGHFTSPVEAVLAGRHRQGWSTVGWSAALCLLQSLQPGSKREDAFQLLPKRRHLNCDLLCQTLFQSQFVNAVYVTFSWEIPAALTTITLSSKKPTKPQLCCVSLGAQMPLHVRCYHENHIITVIRGLRASDVANCLHFALVCNLSPAWPALLKRALCGQRQS